MLLTFERYGMLGGAVAVGAIRHGDRAALIDERGELSYGELDERSNAIANAWREQGLEPGHGVAILVRNHRGFLEAVFAAAKCGARIVLLNTSSRDRRSERSRLAREPTCSSTTRSTPRRSPAWTRRRGAGARGPTRQARTPSTR